MENEPTKSQISLLGTLLLLLIAATAGSCCSWLETDYAPVERPDWPVSSPEEQDLDDRLVDRLYRDAKMQDTLYGLLVVKNGYLVAEEYFNGGSADRSVYLASVTKSFTSALMGIALEECQLESLDRKMLDYFPEYADQLRDPRKGEITLEQMLQMRSGYPWEEFTPGRLDELFSSPDWIPRMVDFTLTSDPGTEFGYSNLTAHLAGVVVAKVCGARLEDLVEVYILNPIGGEASAWSRDPSGYNYGSGALALTARDAARFGLLYLRGGEYQGMQIIPRDWVKSSLARYSTGIYGDGLAGLRDLGYGYFWWSATAGEHDFNYAWGHGGNLIVLVPDQKMVIVTTADNLVGVPGDEAWEKEGAIIKMVGKFIKSLPK
jgi:CubicO group peptidase (beta-lactamase class C family)